MVMMMSLLQLVLEEDIFKDYIYQWNMKINRASTLGKKGGSANVATAGNLAFDKVYITATPTSLSIIGNTVLLTWFLFR